MKKEEKGEFKDFTTSEKEKEYKNKVMFARVSKEGNHIYMFNNEDILNSKYESLLLNISDLEKLLKGEFKSIKVSAMKAKKEEEE